MHEVHTFDLLYPQLERCFAATGIIPPETVLESGEQLIDTAISAYMIRNTIVKLEIA